jgi:hypothetical protein
MKEPTYKLWDIRIKLWDLRIKAATPVVAVIGLFASVLQFNCQQSAQLRRQQEATAENNRIEFNRRMWEKQLDVYMRYSRVVGKIAAGNQNEDELRQDFNEFFTLYWGEMAFFEDKAVEEASVTLRIKIENFLASGAKDRSELKKSALYLLRTCKESSRKSWSGQEGN